MADVLTSLLPRLRALPWVRAIALGGSRARGHERPDSDWDLGLYYRSSAGDRPRVEDLRALGHDGYIVAAGDWGRLMNGGGWLTVDGVRVDLLYRDLDAVEHWASEAAQGRFEVDTVPAYLVGMPTYVLVGEAALGRALFGELPRATFPERLRVSAPRSWGPRAVLSLYCADTFAARGRVVECLGSLYKATFEAAHGRAAARGEWVLNDKRLLEASGLGSLESLLAGRPLDAATLAPLVDEVRAILELPRPTGPRLDGLSEG